MPTKTSIHMGKDYFDLVRRFPLVPIRDKQHLKEAHEIIDELSIVGEDDLTQGQMGYLLVLGDLTSAYEMNADRALTNVVDGLDILKELLKAHGMNGSDLGRALGQRELGAKLLSGQRGISKANAAQLGNYFSVDPTLFLKTR